MRQWGYSEGVILFLVLVLTSASAKAQSAKDSTSHFCRDAIYVELGGSGGLYSVNYDYRITKEMNFRIGLAASYNAIAFPIIASCLVGGHANHFEIGIGTTVQFSSAVNGRSLFRKGEIRRLAIGTALIGYRYQPDSGGFVFRIDYTPLFTFGLFESWGGISLGYAF